MKVILTVALTKTGGGIRMANKTIDLCFAPYKDMSVSDIAWKGEKKVTGTNLSIDPDTNEPTLSVHLGSEESNDENEQNRLVEQYKGHEWKVI